jgi:hypothetical protein
MRAIVVSAILLLGLAGAAPEPEYSAFGDAVRANRNSASELVEIESATRRGDRLRLPLLQPRVPQVESLRPDDFHSPLKLASDAGMQPNTTTSDGAQASLDNLCNTLFTSAQDNDLPVPFFANLLWQESRLRDDDVSRKGALGIAQFMPKVAVEIGLANPFDPMQAIPASARFLQRLRLQFGNLGFVAAAYNAGAHRVIEWLERRASLPRETRDYVVRVTGLPVEAWRKMPIDNDALTFVPRLPCRSLPAFANVEQEQMQQAELERAERVPTPPDEPVAATPPADDVAQETTTKEVREGKHERGHHDVRRIAHEDRASKHESSRAIREARASKNESVHAAREARASKNESLHATREARAAKNEPPHTTHEARASKHEAAHNARGIREKHKSA